MNTKYFTIIAFMLFVSGVFSTHAQNRLDFLLNTLLMPDLMALRLMCK